MAVQFNLLPDIKLEFDRQQRYKRLIYTVTFLSSAVVVAIFLISFLSVNVLQKKLLNDANADIKNYSNKLKEVPDLDKVLTIQSQLNSLPALHQKKHLTSRLFDYLPQITPTNVSIGTLKLDTTANTISISGTSDKIENINKFVDTIKFTKYISEADQSKKVNAFSNVILTKINRDDKTASYTIEATFDPILFDGSSAIALVVPKEVTTRSVVDSPSVSPLFNGQTGKPEDKEQQGAQ
ncbi:PilN domain-containing protein [Candidatus Saccharibacteria bacterium]|nr:PilN domain-containing protein [Candidatus Saccharibacteria bacterium]